MSSWDEPVVRQPGVIGEQVEDEAVLLLPHKGTVLVLNEVGRAVWELVDGQRTVAEISAQISADYEVSYAEAQADVLSFLEDLRARGIIQ